MTEAPVRFSANGEYGLPTDRQLARRLRVFVDGDLLRAVVAYDIEAGWIEVHERNDNGLLVHRDGEWAHRRIHGRVQVLVMPEEGIGQ